MAAPSIRGVTAPVISSGAATSPSSTAVGDLVLIFVWSQGNAVIPDHAIQATFTEIRTHAHNDGSTDGRLSVAYKIAESPSATSYTPYTITNATANQTSIGIVVLTAGTYDVSTLPTSNSATLTTTGTPNPPSITALTGDFRVFALAGWHVTTAAAVAATTMANYTIETQNASASHVTHLAIASRALTSLSNATEDPGAFGDNVTPNGSASMTFAIAGAIAALEGSGSPTTAAATSSATGSIDIDGAGSGTTDAATSTGDGQVEIAGDVTVTTDATTLAAAGEAQDNSGNDGGLAATLEGATSSGTGTIDIDGSASAASASATVSAAGTLDMDGTGASTLASVTQTAAGTIDLDGTASGTTGSTGSAAGTVDITGAATLILDGATLSAQDEQPAGQPTVSQNCIMRRRQMRTHGRRRYRR